MLTISTQPIASQVIRTVIGAQNFQIFIYQKSVGMFVDVSVNGEVIVAGIIARDAVPIVCRTYTGVIGNLLFTDTQGYSDPVYGELGSRYVLIYLTDAEYALIQ